MLTLLQIVEVKPITREHPKMKQAANGPINPNAENSFAHEMAYLRREIVQQKAIIEKLKDEAKKKS